MKSLVLLLLFAGAVLARRIPNYEETPPEPCPQTSSPPSKQVVCYYGGRVPAAQINPCLCTHLVYSSGAGLTENYTLQIDSGVKSASRTLRQRNPSLQLVLSVGGDRVSSEVAETLIKSDEKKSRFAESVGHFLRKSGLNGIELDLELSTDSATRGAKNGLVSLVKALRSELDSEFEPVDREKRDYSVSERIVDDITTSEWTPTRPDGSSARIVRRHSTSTTSPEGSTGEAAAENYLALEKSTNKKLLLMRVPVIPEVIVKRFDLKNISRYIDYFTVPTHNISDSTESGLTYHPSRLMGLADMLNTDSMMDLLTGLGAPHNMIIINIPFAAMRFTLKDPESNAPRSQIVGSPQLISQTKLCRMLNKGGWTMERDEDLTAPYAFKNTTWLAFDDKISVGIKSKYILLRDLAGAAVYQLDDEDWAGACTKNKSQDSPYLLKTLYQSFTKMARKPRGALLQSLEEDIHESTLLTFSGEVELSPYRIVRVIDNLGAVHVVRKNAKTEFECSRQGYFSHPLGCNRFYRCVKFNQYSRDYTVFEYDCPAGLAFDERWEVCVWPGSLPRGSPCTGSSEIAPVPRQRYSCPRVEGYYADPENCRWFFACLDHARDGATPLTAYEFRCPFGLVFDESKLLCDWPWNVDGCGAAGRVGYIGAALYGSASRLQYESGYSSYSASSAVYSSESGSAHTSHGSSAHLGLAQKSSAAYSSAVHSGVGLAGLQASGAGLAAGHGVIVDSGAGAHGVLLDAGHSVNSAAAAAAAASGRAAYAADSYNAGRQFSSYASLPDTLVSGGRIANAEGVILGENIALSGAEGGRFGLVEGIAAHGTAQATGYGARINAVNAANGAYAVNTASAANAAYEANRASAANAAYEANRASAANAAYEANRASAANAAYEANRASAANAAAYEANRASAANAAAYEANRASAANAAYEANRASAANAAYEANRASAANAAYEANRARASNAAYEANRASAANAAYEANRASAANAAAARASGSTLLATNLGAAQATGYRGRFGVVGAGNVIGVSGSTVLAANLEAVNAAGYAARANAANAAYEANAANAAANAAYQANAAANAAYEANAANAAANAAYEANAAANAAHEANAANAAANAAYEANAANAAYEANAANAAARAGSTLFTGTAQAVPVVGSYGRRSRVRFGPTAVPVVQPLLQPTAQPIIQKFVQPVVEQVPTAVYTRPVIRTRPAVVQQFAQPTIQPVVQPVVEQVPTAVYTRPVIRTRPTFVQPTVQPLVVQPTVQPSARVVQPVIQQVPSVVYRGPRVRPLQSVVPVVQPTVQPLIQPVQPVVEQVPTAVYTRPIVRTRPVVAQQVVQPVIQQVPSVVYDAPRVRARPTIQPVVQQVPTAVYTLRARPTSQTLLQPVFQPTAQPDIQRFQPVVQQVPLARARPTVQPIVQSTVQPIFQTVVQPTVQPIIQSTYRPVFQSTVQPSVVPVATYERRPRPRVQQVTVSTAAPVVDGVTGYTYSRPVTPATLSVTPRPLSVTPAPVSVTPASINFNRAFFGTVSTTAAPLPSSTSSSFSAARSGSGRYSSGLDAANIFVSSTPAPQTYVSSSGRFASSLDSANVFVSSTPAPQAYVSVTPPSPSLAYSAGRRRPGLGFVSTISPVGSDSISQFGQRPAFGIPASEIAASYELQGYDALGADYALYNSSGYGLRTGGYQAFAAPVPTTATPASVTFTRNRGRLPVYSTVAAPSTYSTGAPLVSYSTARPNFLDVVSTRQPVASYVTASPAVLSTSLPSVAYTTGAPLAVGISSTTARPQNINAYVANQRLAQDRIAGIGRTGFTRTGSTTRTNNVDGLLDKYSGNFGGLFNGDKNAFVSGVLATDSLSRISTVAPTTAAPIGIVSTTAGYSSSTGGYSTTQGQAQSQQYSSGTSGYSSSQRQSSQSSGSRTQSSRQGSNSRVVDALLNTYSGNFGGILNNNKEGFISQVIAGDSGSRLSGRVSTTTARPVPSTTEAIFRESGYRGSQARRPTSSRGQQVRIENSGEDLNVQALLDQYSGKFGGVLTSDNEAFISGVLTGDLGRGRSQGARGRGYGLSSTESSTLSSSGYSTTTGATGRTQEKNDSPVVIVTRLSDVNPLLIAKLGAQCTCKSNTVTLNRNRGSSRGRARVNYEEDEDSGEGYDDSSLGGNGASGLNGAPRFSTQAPIFSNIPVQGAVPVNFIPSSTVQPAIVSTTPFSTARGRVSVIKTPVVASPVTLSPTIGTVSVQPALYGARSSPVLLNSPAIPVSTAAPVSVAVPLAVDAGAAGGYAGSAQTSQFAGRAFDRYGPGGWRSIDETLQGSVDCQRAGLFRHPKYCNKFYACHWDEWKKRFTLHVFNCPVHLSYDQSMGACNWPSQGPACTDDNLLV